MCLVEPRQGHTRGQNCQLQKNWIWLRMQGLLWRNEYSPCVRNPVNMHPSGPLCRPRLSPLENHSRGAALPWRGLGRVQRSAAAQVRNWETLRGNERHCPLPTGNIPCQVTGRWALAGTATALCYLRISTARGKPWAAGRASPPLALQSQGSTKQPWWELGPGHHARDGSDGTVCVPAVEEGVRSCKALCPGSWQPALSMWPN